MQYSIPDEIVHSHFSRNRDTESLLNVNTHDKKPEEIINPERAVIQGKYDAENNKNLTFLTNSLSLHALMIAQLYKKRWQIELFFKWIKQNLRIKASYGISENAVKTQIWMAISVYVLVASHLKYKISFFKEPNLYFNR